MSKGENNCLRSCHDKIHQLYNNTFTKFHNEETFNLNRATDFGNKYDFFSNLNALKEDEDDIKNKKNVNKDYVNSQS